MSENNQNVDFTLKLSEMDKIFIPKDLDSNIEIEDLANYKTYKLKFWRTVPENFRLVKINRLTQKITSESGFGTKWIVPILTKTIFVPSAILDGKHQFTNIECLTQDKIEISIDLTLIMNITDPVNYKRKGSSQLPQLNSIIQRLLRIYVAKKNFDELVAEECDLVHFDVNGYLNNFEADCGIKINKVIFEKVKLPERLKKLYNDAAEEEQRRKAQAVKLQAEQEKAQAEAKIMSIKAKAEADKIAIIEGAKIDAYIKKMNQLVDTLKEKGIPTTEIAEQLKLEIASKNGNAIFMSGDNIRSNIASGIYAGNIAQQNRNSSKSDTQKSLSNSERLVQMMDFVAMGEPGMSSTYQTLKKELTTIGNDKKIYIDNLGEEEFQAIIKSLNLNNGFNNEQESPKRERTR